MFTRRSHFGCQTFHIFAFDTIVKLLQKKKKKKNLLKLSNVVANAFTKIHTKNMKADGDGSGANGILLKVHIFAGESLLLLLSMPLRLNVLLFNNLKRIFVAAFLYSYCGCSCGIMKVFVVTHFQFHIFAHTDIHSIILLSWTMSRAPDTCEQLFCASSLFFFLLHSQPFPWIAMLKSNFSL